MEGFDSVQAHYRASNYDEKCSHPGEKVYCNQAIYEEHHREIGTTLFIRTRCKMFDMVKT